MNVSKYNDFLFEKLLLEIFILNESFDDEKPVTFEWDLKDNKNTKNKLKNFLSKLSKDLVLKYLEKFLEKIKNLPEIVRRKTLLTYSGIFVTLLSTGFIKNNVSVDKQEVVKELIELNLTSSFDVSQEVVSIAEGGYSNDKNDTGNFVYFKMGGKEVSRFIGSKYGISAPILQKFLGRLPKKEDMENLSYETALEIYKNKYWDNQSIDKYSNQSVATIIYDGCVNQGINGMRKVLIKVLNDNGMSVDENTNVFDEQWIKTINVLNQEKVFKDIKKYREERYKESRTFKVHGNGWLDRLSKIEFN